jgi:hypothetical protein
MKLFERQSNNQEYIPYKIEIQPRLNLDRLDKYSKRYIKKWFDYNKKSHFLRYRFELLKQWIARNSVYTNEYVLRLQKIIDRL